MFSTEEKEDDMDINEDEEDEVNDEDANEQSSDEVIDLYFLWPHI